MVKTLKAVAVAVTVPAIMFVSTPLVSAAGQIEGGDIYRSRNLTKTTAFGNNAEATCGETVQFRVRIHNPGPAEISNVTVSATLPTESGVSHSSTVTVSASDAPDAVTDTAGVKLDKAAKLVYVNGSTELLDPSSAKLATLGDGIVGNGITLATPIGVSTQQFRSVQFSAKVECPDVPPPVSVGVCKALSAQVTDAQQRRASATVTGEANNAEIIGYRIDWGDGTNSNAQTATHQYAAVGTYTITGYVLVKYASGQTEWKTAQDCKATVKFEEGPPPENPSTGICKLLNVQVTDRKSRKVSATLAGEVVRAEIIGYRIDWGDGTNSNTQTAAHQYNQDGTYTITGSVNVKFADGKTEWKTADSCKTTLKFEKKPQPEHPDDDSSNTVINVTVIGGSGQVAGASTISGGTTPTSLPKTGTSDVIAGVIVATVAGTLFHRILVTSRRFIS